MKTPTTMKTPAAMKTPATKKIMPSEFTNYLESMYPYWVESSRLPKGHATSGT